MLGTLNKAIACAALALLLAASLPASPRTEAAEPLQIVALGDSVTQVGAFTARYREHVQRDLGITAQLVNLGTIGSTSGELLDRLRTNPDYRTAVAAGDVITLQIGLNDFNGSRGQYFFGNCGGADNQDCLRGMVATFNANWTALLDEILALTDPARVAIRPMDIYYSSIGFDQANGSFAVFNDYLGQMNEHIAATSLCLGIPLADVHDAFNGPTGDVDPMQAGYILSDQVHTTDAGNRVIADTLRSAGYLPLKSICPDVNNNNRVNIVDIFLIAKNLRGSVTAERQVFDVNGDGHINIVDMSLTVSKTGMFCA